MPFRVMPDLGQGPENIAHPSIEQRCHVLQQQPWPSHHANGSKDMPEEARTLSGKSGTLSRE
jgi:hypothetical protein